MNKKSILIFFLAFIVLPGISLYAQTLGDADGNGSINIVDSLAIAQYSVGIEPTVFFSSAADVDCSGTITIVDALLVAQYSVNIINAFPCPGEEPGVLLVGRFDTRDTAGPKFSWSATTIKARFQGTEVSVKLASSGDNWINVVIDGEVLPPVNIPSGTSGTTPVLLASGLTPGIHTIELIRRTESWVGDMQFKGFTFGSGTLLAPPPASSRRIEFIGDSITCGYGNEGTDQYQSFTTKNENAYLAYGSVTARLLGADQTTVSWSGKGVIRNYGGSTNEVFPEIYSRILPYDTQNLWNPDNWTPQVVVINLCTNDYSVGIPESTTFTTAYKNFVLRIRDQYSEAHIYCALGPMLSGENLESARGYITSVVQSLNNAGDSRVNFIEFPVQDASNGYGEDWHPSIATHALMAKQLADRLRTDLGWY